ncbi:uncharacterized protein LOC125495681 [Beta vulgaris subsp. vulgaris]|uniref:uncharacterized protein LOC125495681 n=1 Tax=Beta vulgaris subsp. vulgaris TaxID=3555 RepID=UPI002546F937|nr:uncharacterized protein LOC125495681 [Beta vulgaris subsp. vulgaris]
MDNIDKKWWMLQRWSDEYEEGVEEYISKAFAIKAQGNQICCPCNVCHYRYWQYRNVVRDHIIVNGFVPRSDKLLDLDINIEKEPDVTEEHDAILDTNDDIEGLLHDTMREGPNEDAKKFYRLIEEGQQELYPGCKKFSKLSFLIHLFIYKCDHKLSNVAMSALLGIFRDTLPDANLPKSFNEAKNVLRVLGLDCQKIDACPNDCMLYWEEHANATSCSVCKTSRWKVTNKEKTNGKDYKIPAKILRYFPIKKRLQRLFMCPETAKYMIWHKTNDSEDELLQHPRDGEAWKTFDKRYPDFAKDARSVRLGLASDGFNPFHNMSIVHNLPGKSKDHANVRQDLKALNWMPELHPQLLEDGKEVFPKSRFSMSLEEKRLFCQVIKNAKLPLGYASNMLDVCKLVKGRSLDIRVMMLIF